MSKELQVAEKGNLQNVSIRKNELKKVSSQLCNIDTDVLDFAGVVLFDKEEFEADPTDWAMFINQEFLSRSKVERDALFNFRVVTATYSEENETYDIKEQNINMLRGGDLLNYSNKLFVNISFADIVRIEATAIFKRYKIGYVFIKK